jgi:uncharacterized protein YqjF (DUF2071 family)
MSKTFLQAEWRKLVMANYSVDKDILKNYLPNKTEIDLWNNICYVSLVGFMFENTRVKGFKIPFHINFEEVNLRFYVRYKDKDGWKRGVVFIKEIVPKPALTFVANTIYKEHYETLPMSHSWINFDNYQTIEYKWKKGKWNSIKAKVDKILSSINEGSEEEFITEHYWGYTKLSENKTSEYGVEHPKWDVYKTLEYNIDVDFGRVYGKDFEILNKEKPVSVFVVEGSEIKVKDGNRI